MSEQKSVSSWSDTIIAGIIAGVIFGLLYAFVSFIEKNTKARMVAFAVIFLPLIGALKPFSRKFLGFIFMCLSSALILIIKWWFFSN